MAAIDSTGVIPDPAAISTWCPDSVRSGVNAPVGVPTSTSSPGRIWCTSQVENSPSGTSRTPIRGRAPAGAQIEYDRRSSRPSSRRRRVSDCPARNAYASASSSGTSKVMATASSHNRLTSATRNRWNSPRSRAGEDKGPATVMLDLLDVLERL